MVELKSSWVRIKKNEGAGYRINVPASFIREHKLQHNDLIDISSIKKIDEEKEMKKVLSSRINVSSET